MTQKFLVVLIFSLFFPVANSFADAVKVSVFAGNGESKWSELGESATSTAIAAPNGLALGNEGQVLIADAESHQVFSVDSDGSIEIIAGCGFAGFAGDGGPATDAFLTKPYSVLSEASGTVLIGDQWNHRIRRVHSDGTLRTVVGSGEGFFGLGNYGGDGGNAKKAGLNFPSGMAEDASGSLYFADQMNGRVRRVNPEGTITTFAGPTGQVTLPLKRPIDVERTPDNALLIVDAGTNQIYSASPEGGVEIWVGPPISESMTPKHPGIYLNFPVAATIGEEGTLYWAETQNNRVCQLLPGEKKLEVLMEGALSTNIRIRGTQLKESANRPKLGRPNDLLLLPDGSLLVADPGAHKVWKISFAATEGEGS